MRALREYLLAPAAPVPAAAHVPAVTRAAAPAPIIGLVAERADAAALAVSLALVAARAHGLGCALAAVHDPGAAGTDGGDRADGEDVAREPRVRAWTAPAARRLAASLRARELPAAAAGRGVCVTLPADPAEAVLAAERTAAAAAGAATVLAAAGARDATFDALLVRCDVVVVAVPPARAALADLAAAAFHERGVPAVVVAATLGPAARARATAGFSPAPALAATLRPALAALREPA